jgi:hypothetical protein
VMEWPRGGRGGIAALVATLRPSRRRCSPRGDVAALAATLQPSWRRCSPSGEIVTGENRDIAALPRCSIVGAALPRYRQHASGGARPRTSIVGCGLAASRQSLALQRRGSRWPCSVAAVVGLAASRQSLALQRRGSRWRCGIVAMRPRGIVGDAAAPAVGCRRAASWSCRGGLGGWSPRSTTSKCWAICSWRR